MKATPETSSGAAGDERGQDLLTRMLDSCPDCIVMLGRDWRFKYANQRAVALLGGAGFMGKVLFEAYPGNLDEPYYTTYRRAMEDGKAGAFEAFYPAPLNIWFKIQAEPDPNGIVVYFSDITARKEAETREQEAADQLSQVMDVTSEAIFSLDRNWRFLLLNRRASALIDPEHKALGKMIWEEFPLLSEVAKAAYRRTMEDGTPGNFEEHYPAPLDKWFEVQSQRSLEGIVVFFRDITDRKEREARAAEQQHLLVASEERYRVLADLNPQAIWAGDAAGNITYANQGFLAYLGLRLEDLAGSGWLEGFASSDRERVVRCWMHSVTTGENYDLEAMLREASTGEYRYWHLRAAPVRDAAGATVQWLGVANDVHDAKTFAGNLLAERTQADRRRVDLEAVYLSTPVALALLEPAGLTFLNLNEKAAEILGRPKEEVLGRPLQAVLGGQRLIPLLRAAAAGQAQRDVLLERGGTESDKHKRYYSVNLSPVFHESGRIRAIAAAVTDLTQQKLAEAALIQSEKLAAVGRLASSISHEINNPLEAITNLLYLIAMDEALPESLKIYVHMAQSEVSRVSQIATQTLRFHRQAVNPTRVTARQLVGAVVHLYTGRLANSAIRIEERYGTATQILCFENDIRQVLNNLIANAIDAMRTGGRLVVRAHEGVRARDQRAGVRITIADTGHGMSEETLRRVFEPFFTTKDLNGTGLGLWISAGIVERHQGSLTVRSRVGVGTVFTLFLPCEEVEVQGDDATQRPLMSVALQA